jgi:hypothetical protein
MQQCGAHSNIRSPWIKARTEKTLQQAYEHARRVEDSDTVREARVRRAGIDQFRDAQLFDTPEPLKLRRVDQAPYELLKRLIRD